VAWGAGGAVLRLEDQPVILVIEDDESIQGVVEDALTEGGFEPATAVSGEEAVTLLKGRLIHYRALVIDISLRGRIDGWEVAQRAREIDPEFPVVYMSGQAPQIGPPRASPTVSCWQSRSRQRSLSPPFRSFSTPVVRRPRQRRKASSVGGPVPFRGLRRFEA
jgi:CheY-like chemotaxis protein